MSRVVARRALEDRPGKHEPILSEEVFTAVQAVYWRKRQTGQPRRGDKRAYLLRRRVFCKSGTKMRGDLGGPEPEVTLMPRFRTFYDGGGAVVQMPLEGARGTSAAQQRDALEWYALAS